MQFKQNLKGLFQRVQNNGFLKSVLTLSSGVVVAQAINFLGMPVVGRVYTPAAIGDYTLITSNASIISSVACLGMMTVFMLPERDEEARGLSRLVTYSTVLLTTIAVIGLWLCTGFFRIFNTEETPYSVSLLVLWLYVVFNIVSNICYAYVNRKKLYRVMFWNPIITAGINVVCGTVFGLLGWGFVGYTAAHILGFVLNILHLIRHANPYASISDPACRCIPLLKSYRRFPIYQMPANLLSSVGQQIPLQMIELVYSSTALGMYSMSLKILSLPSLLLSTPVNRVYFQEASRRYNRGEQIGEFSFNILKTNIKAAILPIAILVVWGEWIFAKFLGEQWRQAGTFAAILGLYQLMQFCANCLSGEFVIIKKNHYELVSSIYSVCINTVLLIISRLYHPNLYIIIALLSVASIARILVYHGIFLKHAGFKVSIYYRFILFYVVLPIVIAWLIKFMIYDEYVVSVLLK